MLFGRIENLGEGTLYDLLKLISFHFICKEEEEFSSGERLLVTDALNGDGRRITDSGMKNLPSSLKALRPGM